MEYDVFISHAADNKDEVARPLALELGRRGLRVWFDETTLTVGDSLRRSIDRGLSRSRFGVVILSPDFLASEWPNRELDGLVSRDDGTTKVILPVWHRVTHREVALYSPILADRVAVPTSIGIPRVADEIVRAIRGGEPRGKPVPPDPDPVASIRSAMLRATGVRELRRCLYEVEGYLSTHPHDPDARLLQASIHSAIRFEETSPRRISSPVSGFSVVASVLLFFVALAVLQKFQAGVEGARVAASPDGDRLMVDVAPEGRLQFRLAWRSGNDLDLSVLTPSGAHIGYGARTTPSGAMLDRDVLAGPGAETVTIPSPARGRYTVETRNFDGPVPVEYELSVLVDGEQQRVFVGRLDDAHSSYRLEVLARR